MVNKENTEDKILNAAREVFHQKGYYAARMDDIAAKAEINQALLHYYFRSKEKLFNTVFEEAVRKFLPRLFEILNGDLSLEVKISRVVDFYFDFLIGNRDIPVFVLSEIRQDPQRILNLFSNVSFDGFIRQVEDEVKRGDIRKVDPAQLFTHLLGLIIFPFIAEPIIRFGFKMDEAQFETYLRNRRKDIPQMMMNYLNPEL